MTIIEAPRKVTALAPPTGFANLIEKARSWRRRRYVAAVQRRLRRYSSEA